MPSALPTARAIDPVWSMPRRNRRSGGDGIGTTIHPSGGRDNFREIAHANDRPKASATSCHALPFTRCTNRSSGGA